MVASMCVLWVTAYQRVTTTLLKHKHILLSLLPLSPAPTTAASRPGPANCQANRFEFEFEPNSTYQALGDPMMICPQTANLLATVPSQYMALLGRSYLS